MNSGEEALNLLAESGMEINKLIATGGGARNAKWLQLKADVLNMPIIKKDIDEAGCLGAAMLVFSADTGMGIEHNSDKKTINPDPEKAKIYENKFENYKKMYPVMKELYQNFK
jgi:xylulokinase